MTDGDYSFPEQMMRLFGDRRMWMAADQIMEIVAAAQSGNCTCDTCVKLRGVSGALDDIRAESTGE